MPNRPVVVHLLLVAWGALALPAAGVAPDALLEPETGAAARLVASLDEPTATLAREVFEQNPELARLAASARAAERRAPQVAALPDPMASLTAFLLSPETRVGPQIAAATISQRLPWFGKLELREREAMLRAAAARAELEARQIELVTELRRQLLELAFLDAEERAVREDRRTLERYEELARARYETGVGLEQAVVKLQAEISRDDNRLLQIAHRRATLAASLAALRAVRPDELPARPALAPPGEAPDLDLETLRSLSRDRRPEVARARALAGAAEAGSALAAKENRPDVTFGLGYTAVGRREDAPGRAIPPVGNGDDIVGFTVGVNLPVWKARIVAGIEEAAEREAAAADQLRATETEIDRVLDELVARLPLVRGQLRLFDTLLVVQAEEALRSAEAAYAAGSAGALDLLDAERVLLEVRVGTARLRADYLITLARLEGALGGPLAATTSGDPT